jgi:hypothetical protein
MKSWMPRVVGNLSHETAAALHPQSDFGSQNRCIGWCAPERLARLGWQAAGAYMLPAGGHAVVESHSGVENHPSRRAAPAPGVAACAGSDGGQDAGSSTAESPTRPIMLTPFYLPPPAGHRNVGETKRRKKRTPDPGSSRSQLQYSIPQR